MAKKNRHPDLPEPLNIKYNPNSLVIWQPRKHFSSRHGFSTEFDTEETTTGNTPKTKRISNNHNGFLSPRAGNRLRKAIKFLFWTSGCYKIIGKKMVTTLAGKISFITLTICAEQLHDDIFIKERFLDQFITMLRKRHRGCRYIWRAEKQKNGRIHFHFLINRYCHYNWVQGTWNQIMSKEGYLKRYQDEMSKLTFKEYVSRQKKQRPDLIPIYKKRFLKGTQEQWTNPPSCKAIGLKDTKKAFYYISKYISKNETDPSTLSKTEKEKLSIKGRIWFCSQEISNIESTIDFIDEKTDRELSLLKKFYPDWFSYEDFCTIIKKSIEELFNVGCYHIYNRFIECFSILNKNELFSTS